MTIHAAGRVSTERTDEVGLIEGMQHIQDGKSGLRTGAVTTLFPLRIVLRLVILRGLRCRVGGIRIVIFTTFRGRTKQLFLERLQACFEIEEFLLSGFNSTLTSKPSELIVSGLKLRDETGDHLLVGRDDLLEEHRIVDVCDISHASWDTRFRQIMQQFLE
ncbi:MAG: hypothetical protein ACKO6N_20145 [Myxococcota bacterium]